MVCLICGNRIPPSRNYTKFFCNDCLNAQDTKMIDKLETVLEALEKSGNIFCYSSMIPMNSLVPYKFISFKIPLKKI